MIQLTNPAYREAFVALEEKSNLTVDDVLAVVPDLQIMVPDLEKYRLFYVTDDGDRLLGFRGTAVETIASFYDRTEYEKHLMSRKNSLVDRIAKTEDEESLQNLRDLLAEVETAIANISQ